MRNNLKDTIIPIMLLDIKGKLILNVLSNVSN